MKNKFFLLCAILSLFSTLNVAGAKIISKREKVKSSQVSPKVRLQLEKAEEQQKKELKMYHKYMGKSEVIHLWKEVKMPNENGFKEPEYIDEKGHWVNVSDPTITIYSPKKPNGQAIIICPGGGFGCLAIKHEGSSMAPWFNSLGVTLVVLKYRLPNGHYKVPLSDAQRAITIVRDNADRLNVNSKKIGIMGSSAGGYLASALATRYSSEKTRPDFQILLYPVITMQDFTHKGTRYNLFKRQLSDAEKLIYSNELIVNEKTPKAFIALSFDDKAVNPENSIKYYESLIKYNVASSLRIYPVGGHGWGYNEYFPYHEIWKKELSDWLKKI